jgi:diguanylate cyclase (GGDEF)-like protein/PAS domain S-box-containing protein
MDQEQQAAATPPSSFRRTVAHASPVPWPEPLSPHHALIASIGGTPTPQPGGGAADLEEVLCSPERLRYEVERASFNDAFLLSPLGHVVLGFDTAILKINLAGADMLGISRAEALSLRFRDLVAPRFRVDFSVFLRHALNGEGEVRMGLQLQVPRSGHEHGLPVTLLATADASGQALRVLIEPAAGRLAALESSEERLRRIVHGVREGSWQINAAGHTSFVNPSMAAMLGYPIEHMLHRPMADFMDEEGRELLERNVSRWQEGLAERHEFKFLRCDGTQCWVRLAVSPLFDAGGRYTGALALASEIVNPVEASERMWRQANFDDLTGVPNRHMFHDRLDSELRKAGRDGAFLALLFIDLDKFKEVNDRLGHDQGDVLLVEAARRIAGCVRATDTVARLGGDEFTVILPGLDHPRSAERVAEDLLASLVQPFQLSSESASISASVGIGLFPGDASDAEGLIRHADQAMYAAKRGGRNAYSYFTPALQTAARLRVSTTLDLRLALAADQFEIHYQPIVSFHGDGVTQAEALLRWRHPERGLLCPADFIPFAESSGLIVEIGDWVFREAARQAKRWQAQLDPAFQISINKSSVQLRSNVAFYENWLDYLAELDLPRGSIVVDIMEDVLMNGARPMLERLQQLRAMGMQVALDDFGTGYSSLSHLKKIEIDRLKIDQSFVRDMERDASHLALCEAIIPMAHKLGLQVVAEGVETARQRDLLAAAGCDYAQGYMFAHPVPAAQFEALAVVRARPRPG